MQIFCKTMYETYINKDENIISERNKSILNIINQNYFNEPWFQVVNNYFSKSIKKILITPEDFEKQILTIK